MAKQIPVVKYKDLLAQFGDSVPRVASYFGIRPAAVYLWDGNDEGNIPTIRAFQVREDFPHLVRMIDEPESKTRNKPKRKRTAA